MEQHSRISFSEYLADPCGALSIPYWKAKNIQIPDHMRIVHDREFDPRLLAEFEDTVYFRLKHDLQRIPPQPEGIRMVTAQRADCDKIASMINESYEDIRTTAADITALTRTPVYAPALWIIAEDDPSGETLGCAMADFDPEAGELILEWVQVLPRFRRRGVGAAMVGELLRRASEQAKFATVSGKEPAALALYRRCGFTGFDFWHVMTKK